jgi:hypothetical protein
MLVFDKDKDSAVAVAVAPVEVICTGMLAITFPACAVIVAEVAVVAPPVEKITVAVPPVPVVGVEVLRTPVVVATVRFTPDNPPPELSVAVIVSVVVLLPSLFTDVGEATMASRLGVTLALRFVIGIIRVAVLARVGSFFGSTQLTVMVAFLVIVLTEPDLKVVENCPVDEVVPVAAPSTPESDFKLKGTFDSTAFDASTAVTVIVVKSVLSGFTCVRDEERYKADGITVCAEFVPRIETATVCFALPAVAVIVALRSEDDAAPAEYLTSSLPEELVVPEEVASTPSVACSAMGTPETAPRDSFKAVTVTVVSSLPSAFTSALERLTKIVFAVGAAGSDPVPPEPVAPAPPPTHPCS